MTYAFGLTQTSLPSWIDFDGRTWATQYLTQDQLAAQGWLPLIQDPEGAFLGYADPVQETRDGQQVAVAYALATPEQETAHRLAAAQTDAYADLAAERNRRVDLYTGANPRARDNRLMASIAILDRVQDGTATATDMDLMDALRQVVPLVQAHDAAAVLIRAEIAAAQDTGAVEAIVSALPTDPRWPA